MTAAHEKPSPPSISVARRQGALPPSLSVMKSYLYHNEQTRITIYFNLQCFYIEPAAMLLLLKYCPEIKVMKLLMLLRCPCDLGKVKTQTLSKM